MNSQPQSQAARYLADLRARGVHVALGMATENINGTVKSVPRVLLKGGRQLPGEFDKVKRHKLGLLELLKTETAGDFMQSSSETLAPEIQIRLRPVASVAPTIETKPKPKSKGVAVGQIPPRFLEEPRKPLREIRPTEQFGDFTVIGRAPSTDRGEICWLCECRHGRHKTLRAWVMRAGQRVTCACEKPNLLITDWSAVDWGQSDKQLAASHKCNWKTVLRQRKRFLKRATQATASAGR